MHAHLEAILADVPIGLAIAAGLGFGLMVSLAVIGLAGLRRTGSTPAPAVNQTPREPAAVAGVHPPEKDQQAPVTAVPKAVPTNVPVAQVRELTAPPSRHDDTTGDPDGNWKLPAEPADAQFFDPDPSERRTRVASLVREMDVFLAYERFGDVEMLVDSAVREFPNHPEFQLKRLEIAKARSDLASFFVTLKILGNNPLATDGHLAQATLMADTIRNNS
ncbi:MAG: hypothetical protein HOI95_27075 [Chromatiales bacterium]|nr:hypothetical protein [Chromatiales bacterium]